MLRINTVTVITVISLLPWLYGCSTQHQSESAVPAPARSDVSRPEGAVRITPGQSSDQGKGVIGTTGEAIGDVVLFPFRAIGEAFTPPDKPE